MTPIFQPARWLGSLDVVSRHRVEGWAWDPQNPAAPLALTIIDNGQILARVLANQYRKDLEVAGIGNGRHAFCVAIPGGLSSLQRHLIQVIGDEDGCEMPSSPKDLAASGAFNEEMQSAISGAIDAMTSTAEREGAMSFLAAQLERLLQASADGDGDRELRLVRQQLARRWGKIALANSSQSKKLAVRRRALIVDDRFPADERDTASHALLSHMQGLQSLGYDVSFIAATTLDPEPAARAPLEALGIHCYGLPFFSTVEEVLRRQAGCFEIIYLHRPSNAAKYLALARHYFRRARILYSIADLHFLRFARQADVARAPKLLALSARLRQVELIAATFADAIITHSSAEATMLRENVEGCAVHVIPWGVSRRTKIKAWVKRQDLAFVGCFDQPADFDAARFLVQKIMPCVWQKAPEIRCLLVGSGAGPRLERLAGPRVDILGEAQVAAIFERIRLTVAPLRFGAGINRCVLDSLAAGIPCVMTPIAAEGLPLPDALAGAVASDIDSLAAEILRLYTDSQSAASMSAAGMKMIAVHYSQAAITKSLKVATKGGRRNV